MINARLLSVALGWLGLVHYGALPSIQAAFYVCPKGCSAMVLPRDMEMINDCLCGEEVDVSAEEAAADPMETRKFLCKGRYKYRRNSASAPRSVADCDCYPPYEKDPRSQECILTSCPRAGNYEPWVGVGKVSSLDDCTCTAPFVKVDTSGQCVRGNGKSNAQVRIKYECPPNSTPTPDIEPQSFADCHCSWGFVRDSRQLCEREFAAYVCPVNSVKRSDLPILERPRGFFDCECLSSEQYERDEEAHACWSVSQIKRRKAKRSSNLYEEIEDANLEVVNTAVTPYQCPPFSLAVATIAHSVDQCQCIPGYGWKVPEMNCVRTSAYKCPEHAYKRFQLQGSEIETSFDDCACARGYFLDAVAQRCVPWILANSNACPPFAILKQWPLQSNANCECLYGLNETVRDEQNEARRKTKYNANSDSSQIIRTSKRECNRRPFDNASPDFSQCPHDSIATTWPVTSANDCTCLFGLEKTSLTLKEVSQGAGDGFHCVATPANKILFDEAAAACRAPYVLHPLSGKCRLPVEETISKSNPEGVLYKGIEYHYELVDDNVMVIQGDIAIGERYVWQVFDPDDPEEITTRVEHVLHGYYNSGRDHRWHHETMCYQVEKSAYPFLRTFKAATEHITHATGFEFQQCGGNNCRTDKSCRNHDYVVVQSVESSCYSFVGRIGGPQRLGISADCGLGNIVHVLLHAVGLRHAIDRVDRDEHVRIAWECIPESKRSYFVVEEMSMTPISHREEDHILEPPSYDLFSIMQHPIDAFVHSDMDESKPHWCPSVVPLVADKDERLDLMKEMGQRDRMTITDVNSVWALYPGLKKKHQKRQNAGESGEAIVEELHDSFMHTNPDTTEIKASANEGKQHRSFGQRLMSFFGAIVTLVGFGALLALLSTELRRRVLLSSSDDFFYEAPLIDSKNDI
ncbi:putative peptidase, metallopeptidase, metallopeptidase, catalytic domain superfamily [Plasmopara halstedii]